MKKLNLFGILGLLAMFAFAITTWSCSSDDEDSPISEVVDYDDSYSGGSSGGSSSGSSSGSSYRKKCTYCGGTKRCENRRLLSASDRTKYCHGTGECYKCKGYGRLQYNDVTGAKKGERCYICKGSGECTFCDGTGICSHCDGTGYE